MDYPEAAILVPITDHATAPEVLLTQRAAHMNTHRGQVAFPGGKRDANDADLLATALREAQEEIGLLPEDVRVLGGLSQVVSLHRILVTPFVGLVPDAKDFLPTSDELDSVFKVPVDFFLEDKRQRTDTINFMDFKLFVPCYSWEGYQIWGLSAIVLVELLNTAFDAGIDLLSPKT